MSDSTFYLVVAGFMVLGIALTLRRGWFPFPFVRVYRDGDGPLFWAAVGLVAVCAVVMLIAFSQTLPA